MANNEPMTDVLLQAIRKFDTIERGVPSVVVSDITALLAEVDRLRAREPGDALCKPARRFTANLWCDRTGEQPTCKRCVEIAERIVAACEQAKGA